MGPSRSEAAPGISESCFVSRIKVTLTSDPNGLDFRYGGCHFVAFRRLGMDAPPLNESPPLEQRGSMCTWHVVAQHNHQDKHRSFIYVYSDVILSTNG